MSTRDIDREKAGYDERCAVLNNATVTGDISIQHPEKTDEMYSIQMYTKSRVYENSIQMYIILN